VDKYGEEVLNELGTEIVRGMWEAIVDKAGPFNVDVNTDNSGLQI
jgi:hypothetical protein